MIFQCFHVSIFRMSSIWIDTDTKFKLLNKIGPFSVGCQLKEKSQCFGGKILTATDAALAAGICNEIGDRDLVCICIWNSVNM